MPILWCDNMDRKDMGVLKAEGQDWIYYGIGDVCYAQNKRTGAVSQLRYRPSAHYPRKEWCAAKFSQVPPEVQREYLLWKMSR